MNTKTAHFNHNLHCINRSPQHCWTKNSSTLRTIPILPTLGNTNSRSLLSLRTKSRRNNCSVKHIHSAGSFSRRLASWTILQLHRCISHASWNLHTLQNCNSQLPNRKSQQFSPQHFKLIAVSSTALGIVLRVIVTTPVNYFALQLASPFGFGLNSAGVIGLLPLIAVFNASVALYTIPIALASNIAILPDSKSNKKNKV